MDLIFSYPMIFPDSSIMMISRNIFWIINNKSPISENESIGRDSKNALNSFDIRFDKIDYENDFIIFVEFEIS